MENNNPASLNKKITTVAVILAGLLLLVIGYYFYLAYSNGGEAVIEDPDKALVEEATKNAQSLDMQAASAVYAELAASETDPEKRARYAIMQGFASNNSGNYEVGIPLLKAVVADPAASNQLKAEALIAMLQVNFKPNSEEALQLIFNDDGIYAEALSGGDINNIEDLKSGINNLYQVADNYHQYAVSQYARAFAEGRYLLNRSDLSESERQESLIFIENALNNGDALLSTELASGFYEMDQVNAVRDALFMSMHMRLFALEVLARTDETKREEVDSYYGYTLDVFSYTLNAPAMWSIESYVRFYYAAYLADVYGEERVGDIQQVMSRVIAETDDRAISNAYSIWPFFEATLSNPESSSADASMIQEVASVDPAFQAFLEARGWVRE